MAKTQKKPDSKNDQKQGGKRVIQPSVTPYRREAAAMLSGFLGFFIILSYFPVDAIFVQGFSSLLKGLLGVGFMMCAPSLILCSIILALHQGKPIIRRAVCALNLPLAMSCFSYGLIHKDLRLPWTDIAGLWEQGIALKGCGVLGSLIGIFFTTCFSNFGSIIIFIVLSAFLCLGVADKTVMDLIDWYAARPAYVPQNHEKPPKRVEENQIDKYESLPPLEEKRNLVTKLFDRIMSKEEYLEVDLTEDPDEKKTKSRRRRKPIVPPLIPLDQKDSYGPKGGEASSVKQRDEEFHLPNTNDSGIVEGEEPITPTPDIFSTELEEGKIQLNRDGISLPMPADVSPNIETLGALEQGIFNHFERINGENAVKREPLSPPQPANVFPENGGTIPVDQEIFTQDVNVKVPPANLFVPDPLEALEKDDNSTSSQLFEPLQGGVDAFFNKDKAVFSPDELFEGVPVQTPMPALKNLSELQMEQAMLNGEKSKPLAQLPVADLKLDEHRTVPVRLYSETGRYRKNNQSFPTQEEAEIPPDSKEIAEEITRNLSQNSVKEEINPLERDFTADISSNQWEVDELELSSVGWDVSENKYEAEKPRVAWRDVEKIPLAHEGVNSVFSHSTRAAVMDLPKERVISQPILEEAPILEEEINVYGDTTLWENEWYTDAPLREEVENAISEGETGGILDYLVKGTPRNPRPRVETPVVTTEYVPDSTGYLEIGLDEQAQDVLREEDTTIPKFNSVFSKEDTESESQVSLEEPKSHDFSEQTGQNVVEKVKEVENVENVVDVEKSPSYLIEKNTTKEENKAYETETPLSHEEIQDRIEETQDEKEETTALTEKITYPPLGKYDYKGDLAYGPLSQKKLALHVLDFSTKKVISQEDSSIEKVEEIEERPAENAETSGGINTEDRKAVLDTIYATIDLLMSQVESSDQEEESQETDIYQIDEEDYTVLEEESSEEEEKPFSSQDLVIDDVESEASEKETEEPEKVELPRKGLSLGRGFKIGLEPIVVEEEIEQKEEESAEQDGSKEKISSGLSLLIEDIPQNTELRGDILEISETPEISDPRFQEEQEDSNKVVSVFKLREEVSEVLDSGEILEKEADFVPAYEKTEQKVEFTSPVYEKTEQKVEYSSPVYEKTEPKVDYSVPVYEKTEPKVDYSVPVYEKTEPKVEFTSPIYPKTEEKVDYSSPIYPKTEEKVDYSSPVHEKAEEKVDYSSPVYKETEEKVDYSSPVYEEVEPKVDYSSPVYEEVEPKVDYSSPVYEDKEADFIPVSETNSYSHSIPVETPSEDSQPKYHENLDDTQENYDITEENWLEEEEIPEERPVVDEVVMENKSVRGNMFTVTDDDPVQQKPMDSFHGRPDPATGSMVDKFPHEQAKTGFVLPDYRDEAKNLPPVEFNTPTKRFDKVYKYPPLDLLNEPSYGDLGEQREELEENLQRLEQTLQSFKVKATMKEVVQGPSVTRYEVELAQGEKLSKIVNLSDDIALALGATGVRIAPIDGKISTMGIEVPNKAVAAVEISQVLGSEQFEVADSKLSFAVGKDITGEAIVGNIAKMPHLLIAGTTGSGKSVCTNSLIISLLYKAGPEEVRLIMVDPKMVELGIYNGIPHLLIPVVTDPKKAAGALQWAVYEMMQRYQKLSELGARDLNAYNEKAKKTEGYEPMAKIVVIIDELADLMMVAAKEVEESINRVAQMGRAAGMHLIIATQRPSSDVLTGLLKSNIPSRIAFAVSSGIDSRIILDTSGAEKLVGRGDMLFRENNGAKPVRIQGCFISDDEVADVVDFVKAEYGPAIYSDEIMEEIDRNVASKEKSNNKDKNSAPIDMTSSQLDDMLYPAIDLIMEEQKVTTSFLQRKLSLGYARAARIVDYIEDMGIIGTPDGGKTRTILISKEKWQEMKFRNGSPGENNRSSGKFEDSAPWTTESDEESY